MIISGKGVKESPVRDAYRNKMEFSFGDEYKDGPLALGMHKRGSFHDIVNVTECKIVDEDFRRIIKGCSGVLRQIQVFRIITECAILDFSVIFL